MNHAAKGVVEVAHLAPVDIPDARALAVTEVDRVEIGEEVIRFRDGAARVAPESPVPHRVAAPPPAERQRRCNVFEDRYYILSQAFDRVGRKLSNEQWDGDAFMLICPA